MGRAHTHRVRQLTGRIALTIMLAAAGIIASASTFSEMTAEEVMTLLAAKTEGTASAGDRSAKERPQTCDGILPATDAVDVNVRDMITKVFGILEGAATLDDCIRGARDFDAEPQVDDRHVWVDSDRGYNIRYSGVTPDVSAAAGIADNDSIAEYCYFFLFPYDSDSHCRERQAQARFCGSMLQELNDMQDVSAGVNTLSTDLFDVVADCGGRLVNLRLMDSRNPDRNSGRYILMFIVQPDAFTPQDDIIAL